MEGIIMSREDFEKIIQDAVEKAVNKKLGVIMKSLDHTNTTVKLIGDALVETDMGILRMHGDLLSATSLAALIAGKYCSFSKKDTDMVRLAKLEYSKRLAHVMEDLDGFKNTEDDCDEREDIDDEPESEIDKLMKELDEIIESIKVKA